MKNIFVLIVSSIMLLSCGSYKTMSSGKADESFILVLGDKKQYKDIVVQIDDEEFQINKLYKASKDHKAMPISTSVGKHKVTVFANGEIVYDENIFLSVQQTKRIVLP